MLDVVEGRIVVETLGNVTWKAVAPDAHVVACIAAAFAGPVAFLAAENESDGEEC